MASQGWPGGILVPRFAARSALNCRTGIEAGCACNQAFEALQTAYNVQRKQFAIASKQIELAEREKKVRLLLPASCLNPKRATPITPGRGHWGGRTGGEKEGGRWLLTEGTTCSVRR